jgi:hypothetical protein
MKKIIIGITIILIFVTIVFGLTKEESEIARTCTSDGITKIFDKFSDSEQTGYIINPFTNDVSQFVCKDGKWIPTIEYADMNKINIEDIIIDSEKMPDVIDEKGRDIIYSSNPVINANENKQIVIGEKIYNVTVTPIIKEVTKCIIQGKPVKIEECLS